MLVRLSILLLATLPLLAIDPVAKMYDDQLTLVENDVVSLAEAMPADKYDFVPQSGNFKNSRTFAEEIRHLATMIYMTARL